MFNGSNGYQVNSYNEADTHRLSSIVEGEDPIAQAMGMQPQQPQQIYKPARAEAGYTINPLDTMLDRQSQQQINANGKTISIAISPDGTITISIGG